MELYSDKMQNLAYRTPAKRHIATRTGLHTQSYPVCMICSIKSCRFEGSKIQLYLENKVVWMKTHL